MAKKCQASTVSSEALWKHTICSLRAEAKRSCVCVCYYRTQEGNVYKTDKSLDGEGDKE